MSTHSCFGEDMLQKISQSTFSLPVVVFFIEFGVSLILLNLMPKLRTDSVGSKFYSVFASAVIFPELKVYLYLA